MLPPVHIEITGSIAVVHPVAAELPFDSSYVILWSA